MANVPVPVLVTLSARPQPLPQPVRQQGQCAPWPRSGPWACSISSRLVTSQRSRPNGAPVWVERRTAEASNRVSPRSLGRPVSRSCTASWVAASASARRRRARRLSSVRSSAMARIRSIRPSSAGECAQGQAQRPGPVRRHRPPAARPVPRPRRRPIRCTIVEVMAAWSCPGQRARTCRPSTSPAARPQTRANAGLALTSRPSASRVATGTSAASRTRRTCASNGRPPSGSGPEIRSCPMCRPRVDHR